MDTYSIITHETTSGNRRNGRIRWERPSYFAEVRTDGRTAYVTGQCRSEREAIALAQAWLNLNDGGTDVPLDGPEAWHYVELEAWLDGEPGAAIELAF